MRKLSIVVWAVLLGLSAGCATQGTTSSAPSGYESPSGTGGGGGGGGGY